MSFDEKIAALIQRLPKLTDHLQTEEATKTALVMPLSRRSGTMFLTRKRWFPNLPPMSEQKRERRSITRS